MHTKTPNQDIQNITLARRNDSAGRIALVTSSHSNSAKYRP
jgi:hypothetical protein